MKKTLLLLFITLIIRTAYCITPYPDNGELLNLGSPTCAIGRPLNEVVAELLKNSDFFDLEEDYITFETSEGLSKTFYGENAPKRLEDLPELTDQDTLLFISKHFIKSQHEGGIGDSCAIFGLYFNRSSKDLKQSVKLMRTSYYTVYESVPLTPFEVLLTQSYSQNANRLCEFIKPNYQYNLFEEGCPKPTSNLQKAEENKAITGKIANNTIFTTETSYVSGTTSTHKIKYKKVDYLLGELNYCPIENEIEETICEGESYLFGNHKLTTTCTDTLKGKTWYGADSTTVLRLTVNPTARTEVDTTIYDDQTLIIDGNRIYKSGDYKETDVTYLGCDSIITYHVKVLHSDTLPATEDTTCYPPLKPGIVVTPNGDGTNDTWQIVHMDHYSHYTIHIYDRQGKEIVKYKNEYPGWDGIYNGNKLPSSDYWFSISLDETDKTIVGHFTLIWE